MGAADQRAPQRENGLMDLLFPLIAHPPPAESVQPGQSPFYRPAVAPQPLAGLDAVPGNPDRDAPSPQRLAAARGITPLVGMELGRARAAVPGGRPARRHRIEQVVEHGAVVPVGAAD